MYKVFEFQSLYISDGSKEIIKYIFRVRFGGDKIFRRKLRQYDGIETKRRKDLLQIGNVREVFFEELMYLSRDFNKVKEIFRK